MSVAGSVAVLSLCALTGALSIVRGWLRLKRRLGIERGLRDAYANENAALVSMVFRLKLELEQTRLSQGRSQIGNRN